MLALKGSLEIPASGSQHGVVCHPRRCLETQGCFGCDNDWEMLLALGILDSYSAQESPS